MHSASLMEKRQSGSPTNSPTRLVAVPAAHKHKAHAIVFAATSEISHAEQRKTASIAPRADTRCLQQIDAASPSISMDCAPVAVTSANNAHDSSLVTTTTNQQIGKTVKSDEQNTPLKLPSETLMHGQTANVASSNSTERPPVAAAVKTNSIAIVLIPNRPRHQN